MKVTVEKAAREFAESEEAKEAGVELIAINPSLVLGPLLFPTLPASCSILADLLTNSFPLLPDLAWPIVHVRDVVTAHSLFFSFDFSRIVQISASSTDRFLQYY